MKVFAWKGGKDGCAFYRLQVPLDELSKLGHSVHAAEQWWGNFVENGEPWYPDVAVGQRVSLDGASTKWRRMNDVFRVYEIDDDLMSVDPTSEAAYGYYGNPAVKERIRYNIAIADRCTVSTEHLAELVSRVNPRVHVVPNTIPDRFFELPDPRPADHFTFGWMGSDTHAMDWREAGDQIRRFLVRNPDARLRTVGAPYAADFDLPGQVAHTEWVLNVPDMFAKLQFHVGLAPLRPHVFNRSKSFVKALEYGSQGIPIIASDYGPYAEYVEHGVNGILIKRPYEWVPAMKSLMDDRALYTRMSKAARVMSWSYRSSKYARTWETALGIDGMIKPKQRFTH